MKKALPVRLGTTLTEVTSYCWFFKKGQGDKMLELQRSPLHALLKPRSYGSFG